MNLGGAVLGGIAQQANTEQELGVKRGNLALSMQQLAGQRLKATVDQIQQIVSSLPTDADRPKVQGTLAALKQDAQYLAAGAGFNPQTMGMSIDAMIANTPTIQTAAQLKGGASTTQAAAAAPGAAITAAATAGGEAAGKLPYSTTDIKPGSAVIPTAAIIPPNGIGGPPAGPTPTAGGVPAAPAPSGASTAPVPAPGAGMAGTNPQGGGVTPNAAGGYTNTNSPALVNLVNGQIPAYNEATGKAIADYITSKQTAIPAVGQTLKAISDLKTALSNLPTGPGTVTANDAAAIASRFGIDLNKVLPNGWQTDPTKVSVAQKNINQLAAAWARAEFPSRITDSDMRIAYAANPGIDWNNPKANSQILGSLESVQRIKLEEAKFFRAEGAKFSATNPPDWTIIDRWNQHLADMKGVPDDVKQAYMSYSDLSANPGVKTAAPMAIPPGTVPSGIGGAPGAPGNPGQIAPADALRELRRRGLIK